MRVRRRFLIAAFALAMTSAPALAQADDVQTGLVGRVVLATRCPVPVGDDDGVCPSVPVQTTLTIRTADGSTEVAQVATDPAGAFAVQLDPGMYLVEAPAAPAGSALQDVAVTVAPDAPTPLTIRLTSGLRRLP